jgi:thiamine pyrophosphokinase
VVSFDLENASSMVDNAVLHERMQTELDSLGCTGARADQIVQELNELACLLIDAVLEGASYDQAE